MRLPTFVNFELLLGIMFTNVITKLIRIHGAQILTIVRALSTRSQVEVSSDPLHTAPRSVLGSPDVSTKEGK